MDEAFIKKVQPNSPEAEQSVIGAMIMDRDAIADVIDIVNADDFYQKQNGILFEAMTELYREGKPVDLVTLQERLKEKDVPPEISSLEFVRDLVNAVPTSPFSSTNFLSNELFTASAISSSSDTVKLSLFIFPPKFCGVVPTLRANSATLIFDRTH